MRIIGIDPGLNITGFGIIDACNGRYKVLKAGTIRGNERVLAEKLGRIHNQLTILLKAEKPDVLVLEEVYSHYKYPRTSIVMAHARAAACLAASQSNIPVVSYSATRVKKAIVGRGNASKNQVQRMVQNLLNIKITHLTEDVSDALAVALTHAYISRGN